MRRYRLSSHANRKRVLTGQVATRCGRLQRRTSWKSFSGKVAADHVHMFISYRAHQILEVREKAIRFLHTMHNGEDETAATCELTGVHMDTAIRKSTPFPDAIRERAAALLPTPFPDAIRERAAALLSGSAT